MCNIKNFDAVERYVLMGCDLDSWCKLKETRNGEILLWAVYYSW